METRTLGNSDLQITPIGFGAWALGGDWGPQDDAQSIATIHHALDRGINWIDTAPVYGLGRSEEIVARALEGRSPRPYVFTKCSLVWGADKQVGNSLKAASIRREVEDSLRRLRTDVIDLYQIHSDPDEEIEEGWQTLADLKAQGKVRYIGVSNFTVSQMRRAQSIAPVTSLQPPYSLLERKIEREILPFCAEQNIGVIVYSPMASGLLTGAMTRERIAALPKSDWRRQASHFRDPALSRGLALAERLREIGARTNHSPGAAAVAWTLRQPAVTAAIVGARHPEQIDDIIDATSLRLSASDLAEIEDFMQ